MSKLCTSKKLLYTILLTTIALTVLTVYGVFFTDKDMNVMSILAGLSWGVTATDVAVYSSKAKAENKIKLVEAMVKNLGETYGVDAVVELARIALEE